MDDSGLQYWQEVGQQEYEEWLEAQDRAAQEAVRAAALVQKWPSLMLWPGKEPIAMGKPSPTNDGSF